VLVLVFFIVFVFYRIANGYYCLDFRGFQIIQTLVYKVLLYLVWSWFCYKNGWYSQLYFNLQEKEKTLNSWGSNTHLDSDESNIGDILETAIQQSPIYYIKHGYGTCSTADVQAMCSITNIPM